MGLCHRVDGNGNLSYAGSPRGCASAGDESEVGRCSGRSTNTKFDRRGSEPLAAHEVLLASVVAINILHRLYRHVE